MEREDVTKIKKAVEGEPTEEEEKPYYYGSKPTIKTGEGGIPDEQMARVSPETTEFAPLFVKVDKYRETVINIQELKTYLAGMKEIFAVIKDIEELKTSAIDMIEGTINRMDSIIANVESLLLKPPGIKFEGYGPGMEDVDKIELSMIELHKEIENLRERLQQMKAK